MCEPERGSRHGLSHVFSIIIRLRPDARCGSHILSSRPARRFAARARVNSRVGETVDVGDDDFGEIRLGIEESRDTPFGPPADRARDVQLRGEVRPARQNEGIEFGKLGVQRVDPDLERVDPVGGERGDRTLSQQPPGVRGGEAGPDREQVLLHGRERRPGLAERRALGVERERHPDHGVEFVDRAVRRDPAHRPSEPASRRGDRSPLRPRLSYISSIEIWP